MHGISKKSVLLVLLAIVLVAGSWFWYGSIKEKQSRVKESGEQDISQKSDIPQWEKDALVERERLGYPALPEGWRLFRSDEYGFEVGYPADKQYVFETVDDRFISDAALRFDIFSFEVYLNKKNDKNRTDYIRGTSGELKEYRKSFIGGYPVIESSDSMKSDEIETLRATIITPKYSYLIHMNSSGEGPIVLTKQEQEVFHDFMSQIRILN